MKLGSLSHFRQDSSRSHPARRNTVELDHARRIQIVAQLTSIAAVMALWPHVDNPLQLAAWWMGLTITLTVLQHLTRSLLVQHDDIALQNYISSAGTLAGGAAWGSLALVGPYHATPQSQAILFMILCSITLAGAGVIRHGRSASAVFIAPCLLPLFILSVVSPPSALPEAGMWLLAFALFAFGVSDFQRGPKTAPDTHRDGSSLPETRQTLLDNANANAAIVLSRGNRVEICNRRFAEMMNHNEEGIAGRRLADAFESRADWRRHARAASNILRRGGTYHCATRLRRHDGSAFWAEITGQVVDSGDSPAQIVWVAFDITDRMMATAREELISAQLHALIGKSADWYWQTDAQHRLMHVTRHIDMSDDTLKRKLGRKWWQFHRPGHGARARQTELREAFENGKGFRNLTVELPDGDTAPLWLSICGTPRFNEHGAFLGHHGIAINVTEEVRRTERIRHLAYHDALTGLPNRRLLTDRLTQAIARAQRYRERVGLILVDLDDFRRINDLGGHAAGDQALLEIADLLRSCVRSCDTVARLGSDEFVILLAELEHAPAAEQVAAKILTTLHMPLAFQGSRNPLSTSIGVAVFPEDAGSATSLIEVADARMYRAKRRGGQRIESREGTPAGPPSGPAPDFLYH